ncbi:hypothetical protein PGTUg99_036823 [Puccinia graminis f. sp. tritici]|uniref:Uncharacterized protein n=1 Tax=Puccinia graminis f. sp. tritici TaxID=56615 RepID=A0A5B0SMK8_PUCGR|nr:hypothetical protein PGTUg99_036823 [Puccinia graminis f. sp. tritici]
MNEIEEMDDRDALARHQLQHRADFVAKCFGRLAECDFDPGSTEAPDLSIDRLRPKKYLLTELHSSLLPALRLRIIGLWQALSYPQWMPRNAAHILHYVIQNQPELEMIVDRIIWVINDLIPGRIHKSNQTNDQHFKEFKQYRLHGLDTSARSEMQNELASFFTQCRGASEQLMLPAGYQIYVQPSSTNDLLRSIDSVIRWSKGPELHFIYDHWKLAMKSMEKTLDDLLLAMSPEHALYSEPFTELAQTFIPVIKLSKLFFRKMTTDGMSQKNLPFYTEMSSDQLSSLKRSADVITDSVSHLFFCLPRSDERHEISSATIFTGEIKKILTRFQSCLLLVDLYIIPRCTEINVCSSPTSLKTWIVTWNTLLYQASHNSIQACESIVIN